LAQTISETGISEYAAPTTLAEAAELMADGNATVVAGGTDLMVQIEAGRRHYKDRLVNIRRVADMRGIEIVDDTVRIGALTTVTEVLNDPLLAEVAPVLRETANRFASSQLRNMATLGGNICNASPAGDTIIPMLLLDAEVALTSWQGAPRSRYVPLADFFTGPSKTVIEDTEILSEIRFAKPKPGFEARFRKSGPRPALEISTVSAGFGAVVGADGLSGVRIALGAVAPVPYRARKTEAFLEGKALSAEVVEEAAGIAAGEVTPIDDVRSTAWYRTHLVRIFVRRLLNPETA